MGQEPLESKVFMKIQHHKTQAHFGRNCYLESYKIQILISSIWSRTLEVSVIFFVFTQISKNHLSKKVTKFLRYLVKL